MSSSKKTILVLIFLATAVTNSTFAMRGGRSESGYDAVVAFESRGSWCNGTWLTSSPGQDSVMATAAHCLENFRSGGVHILAGIGAGARSTGVSVHPNASLSAKTDHTHDFALVYFPSGTGGGGVSIAIRPMSINDSVTPVGWETSSKQKKSAGNKVAGFNYTRSSGERMGYLLHEAWGGLSDQEGESGSPLFNANGELVAVASGCGNDLLTNVPGILRAGWSCTYTAATSLFSLETLADAKRFQSGALSAIDVSSLVALRIAPSSPSSPIGGANTNNPSQLTPTQPANTPRQVAQTPPILQPSPTQSATSIIGGPAISATNPLDTLTQSPRGNEVSDLEGISAPVKKRKLAQIQDLPLPEWLEDLLGMPDRTAHHAHPDRTGRIDRLSRGEFKENLDEGDESGVKPPPKKGKKAELSENLE